jgi:hypothetical protein
MAFDASTWRLAAAQALTVASVGGAASSSTVFGTETYAIACSFPGSVSSTGGMRIAVIDGTTTVNSTTGTFLPANWIQEFKVTPGQRVSAISNDAGTPSLSITELTK